MSAALTIARTMLDHMPRPKVTRGYFTPERVVEMVEHCERVALPRILKRWPSPFNYWKLVALYDDAFERAAGDPSGVSDVAKYGFLVLWSACISAAKTIAYKTRSGRNTPEVRARIFDYLDRVSRRSPLFRAGVQAAPLFKKRRGQRIYLEGVPKNSPVRRYA